MYHLYNRYQDEGWEKIGEFRTFGHADNEARKHSHDAICYGMQQVRAEDGTVLVTYSAGTKGKPCQY